MTFNDAMYILITLESFMENMQTNMLYIYALIKIVNRSVTTNVIHSWFL